MTFCQTQTTNVLKTFNPLNKSKRLGPGHRPSCLELGHCDCKWELLIQVNTAQTPYMVVMRSGVVTQDNGSYLKTQQAPSLLSGCYCDSK